MSADRIHLMGSYGEPETAVEMMDDDDDDDSSSSSSSNNISSSSNNNDSDNDELMRRTVASTNNQFSSETNTNLTSSNNYLKEQDLINEQNVENNSGSGDAVVIVEEDEERKRFQIELEFVQSLANPNYLNFLAQRGYFRNQTFLNYLKYLLYWKEPEYVKHIVYPQCLSLLELMQHEQFLKEIVNAQCSKYIDEQLLLIWLHYKRRHDWIRIEPCKVKVDNDNPNNVSETNTIENIYQKAKDSPASTTTSLSTRSSLMKMLTESNTLLNEDSPFEATQFLANEKF
jgi:mediator of RNA polymerase II transcription subunit 31